MRSLSNLPAIGAALLVVSLVTACGANVATTQGDDTNQDGSDSGGSARELASASSDTDARVDALCAVEAGPTRREQVCHRWTCDRRALRPSRWTGASESCLAGAADDESREDAMRAINTYRFLANVPEVEVDRTWDAPAQDCALLAHANDKLSHEPPADWSCWSDRGARASKVSLIANKSAALAIDPFIQDPKNEETMVHRRWLLSEKITRLGIGSTDRYACVVVDGRAFDDEQSKKDKDDDDDSTTPTASWVAWPPAGPVPFDVFAANQLDEAGWTVQSSKFDLDDAKVDVSVDGVAVPVTVKRLARTLGSLSALRLVPTGWKTEAGKRYAVRVETRKLVIAYSVEPTDCP